MRLSQHRRSFSPAQSLIVIAVLERACPEPPQFLCGELMRFRDNLRVTLRANIEQSVNELPPVQLEGCWSSEPIESSVSKPSVNVESLEHRQSLAALVKEYQRYKGNSDARREIVTALGESPEPAVVYTLIEALEDEIADIQQIAARGLGRHGCEGLAALLKAIAFERHSDNFYRAAHAALYLLQFHAPLRDRQTMSLLLLAMVGPEPAVRAPILACEAIPG